MDFQRVSRVFDVITAQRRLQNLSDSGQWRSDQAAAMQDFTDETDEDIEAYIIMCIICDLAQSVQCRARVGNILRDRAAAMHRYFTYLIGISKGDSE